MDRLRNQEEARQFLRGLGLKVGEGVVRVVVDTLLGKNGRSRYSLWAHGRPMDGRERQPICGKGTVDKIESLYREGKLARYLAYLDTAEAGIEELERQGATHDKENAAVSGEVDGHELVILPWQNNNLRVMKYMEGPVRDVARLYVQNAGTEVARNCRGLLMATGGEKRLELDHKLHWTSTAYTLEDGSAKWVDIDPGST